MWTFGKKITAGFILSFTILAIVGGVAYQSVTALAKTSYAVAQTHVVLEHLSNVLGLLKDAETGQRGFVITGDDAFLEPYAQALTAIPAMLHDLRDLTADNPVQQRRLDQAEPLVDAKLAELKAAIEMRRSRGFEATAEHIRAGLGKRAMDSLRVILGDMERDERELLKQRALDVEASVAGARSTILLGTLVGLLLVTGAAFVITRSLATQIGSAVQHVQSSSAELQTAANQQVAGAKEQATAMTRSRRRSASCSRRRARSPRARGASRSSRARQAPRRGPASSR